MNLTFKIPQLAICFSTKPKKYVGLVLGLFFKITLPTKHEALPGLATNVQARFPYALSHKNAHTAKTSESCFGEKTKSFFHESILVHKNFFMQLGDFIFLKMQFCFRNFCVEIKNGQHKEAFLS